METGCGKANREKGMAEAARAMLSESKAVVVCLEFGEHSQKKQNRYAAGLAVISLRGVWVLREPEFAAESEQRP